VELSGLVNIVGLFMAVLKTVAQKTAPVFHLSRNEADSSFNYALSGYDASAA
jgi:hypothetical protein